MSLLFRVYMGIQDYLLMNSNFLDCSSSVSPADSDAGSLSGSDLGSSGSDYGDLRAKVTRRMAGCVLQEASQQGQQASGRVKSHMNQANMDSFSDNSFKNRANSSPFHGADHLPYYQETRAAVIQKSPWLQECRMKTNQHAASTQGGRYRGIEQNRTDPNDRRYRARRTRASGSDMKVVFLGGCGSGHSAGGTGVFLPRVPDGPTQMKKKPGCSTVLIPTRVLQALELHFSRASGSTTRYVNDPQGSVGDEFIMRNKVENGDPRVEMEMKLPQEWTY